MGNFGDDAGTRATLTLATGLVSKTSTIREEDESVDRARRLKRLFTCEISYLFIYTTQLLRVLLKSNFTIIFWRLSGRRVNNAIICLVTALSCTRVLNFNLGFFSSIAYVFCSFSMVISLELYWISAR